MIIQFFVPPLDTAWRFTKDWAAPQSFLDRHDNQETLKGTTFMKQWAAYCKIEQYPGYNTPGYADWLKNFNAWREEQEQARGFPQFLSGTVVVFDRYHVSHSGDHAITLRVLASPDPLLTPKKLKGKMTGAGRIYLKIDELNTFPPMEQATL